MSNQQDIYGTKHTGNNKNPRLIFANNKEELEKIKNDKKITFDENEAEYLEEEETDSEETDSEEINETNIKKEIEEKFNKKEIDETNIKKEIEEKFNKKEIMEKFNEKEIIKKCENIKIEKRKISEIIFNNLAQEQPLKINFFDIVYKKYIRDNNLKAFENDSKNKDLNTILNAILNIGETKDTVKGKEIYRNFKEFCTDYNVYTNFSTDVNIPCNQFKKILNNADFIPILSEEEINKLKDIINNINYYMTDKRDHKGFFKYHKADIIVCLLKYFVDYCNLYSYIRSLILKNASRGDKKVWACLNSKKLAKHKIESIFNIIEEINEIANIISSMNINIKQDTFEFKIRFEKIKREYLATTRKC